MFFKACIFALFLRANAVIYKLNDTEYDRMPSLYELDNYEKCLRSDGLYCVVKITLSASPDNQLMRMIQEYSEARIHYNHTYIDWGICVSSRCKNYDLKGDTRLSIEKCLNQSFYNEHRLEAKITVHYCNNSKERHQYDFGDWIFGFVLAFIISLNILATLYDIRLRIFNNEIGNQYLLGFSIIRNWGLLVAHHNDPNFNKFVSIHGIRTILSFGMVLGHTMFIFCSGFVDNPEALEQAYQTPFSYIIFNGPMVIQTYFIISGCLFSYTLAVNPHWLKSFFVPILYRWCRLTPGLALLLGFITTWYRHLGTGPLWNFYVSPVVNDCKQYWWSHILYFNNYIKEYCNIQTWYLAADFQMYAIALILFIATRNRGRIFAIFLLFFIGCAGPVLHDWLQDINGVFITYPEVYRTFSDDSFAVVYVSFYNNLCCFSMGLILGLLTFNANKYKIYFSKHKRILTPLFWTLCLLVLLLFMSGYFLYPNGERPSLHIRIAYSALHRPILGAIMFIGITMIIFKVEDNFRAFIEWPGWRVPSRLTYGVFLVHICIIHYIQGTRTQLYNISIFNVIIMHLGVVWMSYLFALPIYLMVKKPMSNITKLCLLYASTRFLVNKKK
ncbi:O-acyltransferase like protein-like isoform X1 [Pieris brassicae]|uniref:O-acyltransferase like protein-like isoform X1 n=1 Tax=Pieris brassicae TaxID=7116 RepID=UPI001E6618BF|nr:O-acyltransferase like protein-like isoform X1 [Pieris brassicae]